MAQHYIPVPDSFNSLLGKYIMDINTKEIFLITRDGQVMKMVPVAKNGLLSSSDKKIDANRYIESNAQDIEIITQLERKGVKHVSRPTTSDELEYKRARNRINRRKAYLKERAQHLNISLPSNDDVKNAALSIKIQDYNPELQLPHQNNSNEQVKSFQIQQTSIPSSKIELNIISNDAKPIIDWWNGNFGLNYIRLRKGYLGKTTEKIPMLGECEIEYFMPNDDINIAMTYKEFQNKLDSYYKLSRNISIEDRLDRIENTEFREINVHKNEFTIEIIETQPTVVIDPAQIEKLVSCGTIINPNGIVCT